MEKDFVLLEIACTQKRLATLQEYLVMKEDKLIKESRQMFLETCINSIQKGIDYIRKEIK